MMVIWWKFGRNSEKKYIIPDFKDETEVEMWLQYRNNAKIQIYNRLIIEEILWVVRSAIENIEL